MGLLVLRSHTRTVQSSEHVTGMLPCSMATPARVRVEGRASGWARVGGRHAALQQATPAWIRVEGRASGWARVGGRHAALQHGDACVG